MNALPSKTARRPALTLCRFADIPLKPRKDWLVHGLLGRAELSCVFGPPGCGKSALVGDLAAHVALGRPWFGRRVGQGGVLYVAAERAALVSRRFAAFRLYHAIEDAPLAVVSGAIDLRTTQEHVAEIIGYARDLREEAGTLALIIVDTNSRAMAGGDENSPKDTGAMVAAYGRLQEMTGAHVLIVHHTPQDGTQRLRGHGALLGAVDCTIGVEKSPAGPRVASLDKANDVGEEVRLAFDLESVDLYRDEETQEITTAPVVVPVDGPTPAVHDARKRLPKAAQIALNALGEAIAECGAIPPAANHIPRDTKTVTLEQWREYAYRLGICGSDEHRARRQAFSRAHETLLASRRIGVWEPHVWLSD